MQARPELCQQTVELGGSLLWILLTHGTDHRTQDCLETPHRTRAENVAGPRASLVRAAPFDRIGYIDSGAR